MNYLLCSPAGLRLRNRRFENSRVHFEKKSANKRFLRSICLTRDRIFSTFIAIR